MLRSDTFMLSDIDATTRLAQSIIPHLRKGDMLALAGDLGVGKTEFARALLRELGVKGDIPSPTFMLIQTYELPQFLVSHFDLYRLKSANELDELGWDDALVDGVTIVEWPDRAEGRLPNNRLVLSFAMTGGEERVCRLEKKGDWANRFQSK